MNTARLSVKPEFANTTPGVPKVLARHFKPQAAATFAPRHVGAGRRRNRDANQHGGHRPPQADITAAADTGTDPKRQRNGQARQLRSEARQNAKQGFKDQDAQKERRISPASFAGQR